MISASRIKIIPMPDCAALIGRLILSKKSL